MSSAWPAHSPSPVATSQGKTLLLGVALSPLVAPMVVIGLGLLQALVWLRLNQSILGLVLGHVLITLAYVVRALLAGLVHFDQNSNSPP
ncbi:hypothetical protein [Bradyrhizobium lupini]|uniref:hypothetical protein n=1 Tax=Rhizobium lupini TaxID=136996 RepID=UPI0034C617E9